MDRVLRFASPHLRVEAVGAHQIFLLGERERFLLQGHMHGLVASLIDGRRTEWEIIQALEGRASAPEVLYALLTLEQKGYITASPLDVSEEVAAFWSGLGVEPSLAQKRLTATPVGVFSFGGAPPSALLEALSGAGVVLNEDAPLRLVVVRDYLEPGLEAISEQARRESLSWMPIKPTGTSVWWGPLFRRDGPCWRCLAQRLRTNRPVDAFLARLGREAPLTPPSAKLPTSARAAFDLAALSIARWIVSGGQGALHQKLTSFDLRKGTLEEHPVSRRPQCEGCGSPRLFAKSASQPVQLQPKPKHFTEDGGYRSITPEETFTRYQHLISPLTGVVTHVEPLPGKRHPLRPIHQSSFFVCPPVDRPLQGDEFSRPALGKGRTMAQSRAGALSEAIERYSCVFQGDEPRQSATLSEMGEDARSPDVLQNFSKAQHQQRDQLNAAQRDLRRMIPLAFDAKQPLEWTPAWSLTFEKRRYLPLAYCYLNAPMPPEKEFCYLDPNGHAAGNCLEEAILQGFFELSERDAVGIWWYNRVRRPAVDLASFGEPYFLSLLAHYQELGYRAWVLDVTNDLGIPVFVALAHNETEGRFYIGFGSHLEARLGVQRALTELNQLFDLPSDKKAPWGDAPLGDDAFLFPERDLPMRQKGDFQEVHHNDLRGDVLECVSRASQLGLETIVLDQTRPDIGLCAVKVVVPGLRHFWPRFGPGRLYDAPVRLGWLPHARKEEELNPVPLYL